jgi:hypothetical protein
MVVVPLRTITTLTNIRLELMLDGRPADVVIVPSDRWHYLRLALPRDRDAPRFRRLDFRVADAPPGIESVLMIGKVEPK